MKRILINATHNEEVRVALCKDAYVYDFDLENRTREQTKANIYKGSVTRIEPSLEAAFVEYDDGSRSGFLPLRNIANEYLNNPNREGSIKNLLKEGTEVIVQIEKEERGNKGAALSTYISLAGRYLVLMPNNTKGGGISRQISGKVRDDMRAVIAKLDIPKGMSIIVRTAGIGKSYEELQRDLEHLLNTWHNIISKSLKVPAPSLLNQEAGVVTRAMRDYLRDDIDEIWIDSQNAYNEAASFISAVMPTQMNKLRKYTHYEPLFVHFNIEAQIESAYQREVRLPSGGSIVIDQTEAMVAIDINSSKSTKGADVAETAYHTNLEAADEIARQLRLRDMGGLIVIDFIDMAEPSHQKNVEKRLIDATRFDRARVQFAEISRFGLMEMSRQRLRPSLEEATGYICPRCHGNGMIRDIRSLALSIMRQIEQLALRHGSGEVQAEVPTEIAAFLLNEKRESLVYLEQDSKTRITILPHAHLESPNFSLHFNPDGFTPASYDRIVDAEEQQTTGRGYEVNWQTEPASTHGTNHWHNNKANNTSKTSPNKTSNTSNNTNNNTNNTTTNNTSQNQTPQRVEQAPPAPAAVAWLANLFAPKVQAKLANGLQNSEVAAAIESIVNTGATSLGAMGSIDLPTPTQNNTPKKSDTTKSEYKPKPRYDHKQGSSHNQSHQHNKYHKKPNDKTHDNKTQKVAQEQKSSTAQTSTAQTSTPQPKRDNRQHEPKAIAPEVGSTANPEKTKSEQKPQVVSSGAHAKTDNKTDTTSDNKPQKTTSANPSKDGNQSNSNQSNNTKDNKGNGEKDNKNTLNLRITKLPQTAAAINVVHLSLDQSKNDNANNKVDAEKADAEPTISKTATHAQDNHEAVADNKAQNTMQGELVQDNADSPKAVSKQDNDQPSDQKNSTPKADILQKTVAKSQTPTQSATASDSHHLNDDKLSKLAEQMQRAINDPRVVQHAKQRTQAITGTAGDFIRRQLKDADIRLNTQGFVACFLQAVLASKQVSKVDFANYGYAPLSQAYLDSFDKANQSVGAFSTPQGKTDAPIYANKERASNDPRGQKPPQDTAPPTDNTAGEPMPSQQNNPDKAHYNGLDEDGLGSDDVNQAPNNTPSTADNSADHSADNLSKHIGTDDNQNATTSGDIDDTATQKADVTPDNSTDNNTDNSTDSGIKPNPVRYRNMIETVAEQLLSQSASVLQLAIPKAKSKNSAKKTTKVAIKIPKADNKPKTEIRKRKPKAGTDTANNQETQDHLNDEPNNSSSNEPS